MKKALFLFLLLTIQYYSFSQWQQLGSTYLTNTVTDNISLDMDDGGTLYTAFKPFSDNFLYVNKLVGGNWVQVGSSASLDPIAEGNMALGTDGFPIVVYRKYNDSIVVRKFNGTDWQTVGSGPFAKGDYPRIAVNAFNVIHVVFNNKAVFPWGTSVYKFEGSAWVPLHSQYVENQQASFTDIDFDSNNNAVVCFRRESTGQMSVFRSNGSSWIPAGNTQFTPTNVFYGRLTIDNADVPYVTFSEANLNNAGSVMYLNGSSWEYLGQPGFTVDAVDYSPLVFDASNTPYIAYQNGSTKLMRYNGVQWEQVDVSPGLGGDHDLIFNQFGNPVLALTIINQNYNLTVKQLCSAVSVDQEVSVCNGNVYEIGGQQLSVAGTYQITLVSQSGCDSTVNVELNILPQINSYQEITICNGESVQVGTSILTSSGLYTTVLEAVSGCDSTVTTLLNVLPLNESIQEIELCFGDAISVGTSTYNQSGTYSDVLSGINGCDSLVTTVLTVKSPINTTVTVNNLELTADQSDATYQWIDCSSMNAISGETAQNFTVTVSGDYAVEITYEGCSAISDCITLEGLGLSEEKLEFTVFPNPVLNVCTIEGARYDKIVVFDVSGRQLIEFSKDHLMKNTIDLEQLEIGQYILEITNDGILQGRVTIFKSST